MFLSSFQILNTSFKNHLLLKTLRTFSQFWVFFGLFLSSFQQQQKKFRTFLKNFILKSFQSFTVTGNCHFRSPDSVVRCLSFGCAGSLPSCTSVLCGRYEDFLWGDGKLQGSMTSCPPGGTTFYPRLVAGGGGNSKIPTTKFYVFRSRGSVMFMTFPPKDHHWDSFMSLSSQPLSSSQEVLSSATLRVSVLSITDVRNADCLPSAKVGHSSRCSRNLECVFVFEFTIDASACCIDRGSWL